MIHWCLPLEVRAIYGRDAVHQLRLNLPVLADGLPPAAAVVEELSREVHVGLCHLSTCRMFQHSDIIFRIRKGVLSTGRFMWKACLLLTAPCLPCRSGTSSIPLALQRKMLIDPIVAIFGIKIIEVFGIHALLLVHLPVGYLHNTPVLFHLASLPPLLP